jgi:hypothetical protein
MYPLAPNTRRSLGKLDGSLNKAPRNRLEALAAGCVAHNAILNGRHVEWIKI